MRVSGVSQELCKKHAVEFCALEAWREFRKKGANEGLTSTVDQFCNIIFQFVQDSDLRNGNLDLKVEAERIADLCTSKANRSVQRVILVALRKIQNI